MLPFIIFAGFGVALLIGTYHPILGPRLYQQHWPGYYPERALRRKATMRYSLLGMTFILIGVVLLLQSFHITLLSSTSVILLSICTMCAMISFALGRSLRK